MIDKALAVGASFDWMSEARTLALNIVRRPTVCIWFHASHGGGIWNVRRQAAKRSGCNVWGAGIDGEWGFVYTRQSDEYAVAAAILAHGVPCYQMKTWNKYELSR